MPLKIPGPYRGLRNGLNQGVRIAIFQSLVCVCKDLPHPWRPPESRYPPFHGGNAGSNPAGDANILKKLLRLTLSPEGSKGFDKEGTPHSAHLLGTLSRQNHSYDVRLAPRLFRLSRPYRLYRAPDSQFENPGSIPDSASKPSSLKITTIN